LAEAKKNAKRKKTKERQTWIYKADMVRDFAWTASRKFVWDALPHYNEDGKRVMCMSYYPEEAYPIYSKYSTKAVAHTLKSYSKYSIPYPYPVAISVEASNGMEYPMICFNYGRAEEDGTYTERAKYGAIGVIIHEVGHNYFPMIINSDERQWTWFDEGLNTFMQYLAESEFNNTAGDRDPVQGITRYMASSPDRLEPIMTNSENIVNFGANAYSKPAAGLNLLRETIMGRELFDYAFKEYARRWAFKHPTPADFFRTMEDASGVDLDWFWRGWFFGIEPVDISLDTRVYSKISITPI
jgi:aminopeptidase N